MKLSVRIPQEMATALEGEGSKSRQIRIILSRYWRLQSLSRSHPDIALKAALDFAKELDK